MKNLNLFFLVLLLGLSYTSFAQQQTLYPADDVYTRDVTNNPTLNNTSLRVDAGTPNDVSYIRFNLSDLTGMVDVSTSTIKLELTASNGSGACDLEVYLVQEVLNDGSQTAWNESSLGSFTYANRPAKIGSNPISLGCNYTAPKMSWDLDVCQLPANGNVTFVVERSTSNRMIFKSKDATTSNQTDDPKLIVTPNVGSGCGGGGGNTAPSVSFTSPMDNATFTEAEDQNGIAVTASASDSDGNVAGVELIVNGSMSQGTDNTAPYAWTLPSLGVGTHSLQVIATDDDGATTTDMISISVEADNNGGGGSTVWVEGNNGIIYYNDGNVGINTDNPDAELTVGGMIHTQSIKVTETAGGADFVFEKDYDLPSLKEVEAFINKNQHLPEIPSAQEMEEEGLDLAKFNIKLLQKVEELTLYLIELQKKNEQLELEVQALKKEGK